MLNHRDQLLFPRLVRIPDSFAHLSRSDPDSQVVQLYRLDWRSVDDEKRNKHQKWVALRDDTTIPFHPLTSPEWEARLDSLTFAITDDYYNEILRNARNAQVEWCQNRGSDAYIRDFCLKTAEAAVSVAFYILTDCMWDQKAAAPDRKSPGYWMRGEGREAYRVASLVRFWDQQTGRGLIWWKAGLDKLEEYVKEDSTFYRGMTHPKETELIQDLIHSFNTRLEMYEKAIAPLLMEAPLFGKGEPEAPPPKYMTASADGPLGWTPPKTVKILSKPSTKFTVDPGGMAPPQEPEVVRRGMSPARMTVPMGDDVMSAGYEATTVGTLSGYNRTRMAPARTKIIVNDEGIPGSKRSQNLVLDQDMRMVRGPKQ